MEAANLSPESLAPYPTELVVDEHLRLRLTTPEDADTLEQWMAEPAVANDWSDGQPVSRQEIEAKYVGARLPEVACYLMHFNNQPAGFIQAWQKANGRKGLDMFVAADQQGHGIGAATARALAEDLTARGWSDITADPAVNNERAIRAWQKAGFEPTGEYGTDNDYVTQLMVFHPGRRPDDLPPNPFRFRPV